MSFETGGRAAFDSRPYTAAVTPNERKETITACDVAVDARSGGGPTVWTYRTGGLAIARGDAVFVPLGPRTVLGIVVRVYEARQEDLAFPISHLRGILNQIVGIRIPEPVFRLVEFVADEYVCPLSVAIGLATPPGVRERVVSSWAPTGSTTRHELSAIQEEALAVVTEMGAMRDRKGRRVTAAVRRALRGLAAKGLVKEAMMLEPFEASQGSELLRLTPDVGRLDKFLEKDAKRRPAQALVVSGLMGAQASALTAAEIRALTGVTQTTVKALLQTELLEHVDVAELVVRKAIEPNPDQQKAIRPIVQSITSAKPDAYLLFGVTGSGKTEVYLRAAAEALRLGKQVLYLVPEIALAAQAISRLRERFGTKVTVLHSELSPVERLHNWARVQSGEAPVVLGARSALFAPLSNLGLIIVDEEHETSYKQESAPRYHAKRTALELARLHGAPLVLGSATPSIESFYEAETGELTLLELPSRAASAELPTVHIEDLSAGYRSSHPAILTEELSRRLQETLSRREQTILFLNRRAYAPFILCRDCGHSFTCTRCAVAMTFSRRDRQLRCHHCGRRERPPDVCPKCQGTRLQPVGVGTEKVEEAVREAFPAARIARLDRDIAQRRGALEDTLAKFRTGEIDVLVGTQMVAKGLDFPNVTLVGVVLADTSLNLPDFRAAERTFQLLSQVAGRAGRGSSPGHVVIQTFNPGHIAIEAAKEHDYRRIYSLILAERKAAHYPPFRRLVNILVSGKNRTHVQDESSAAADLLEGMPEAEILGPVDCAIERLQDHWRRHLLVKLPAGESAKEIDARLQKLPGNAQVLVDVDAYMLS